MLSPRLSKSDLRELVAKLLRAEGSSEETLRWLERIECTVSHLYSGQGDDDDHWSGHGTQLLY